MKDRDSRSLKERSVSRRVIGQIQGTEHGPLVLCIGGIHGNERSGLIAAQRVIRRLEERRPRFRGRFVALAGNLRALARGKRFVDVDLNRHWTVDDVGTWEADLPGEGARAEDFERRELFEILSAEFRRAGEPAVFLDLHTSSADGPPFVSIGDTLRNRAFAFRIGLPVILGLEEQIDGALLEYVNNLGHVTLGVEGGMHDSPSSVERLEAVLWLALLNAGSLRAEEFPEAESYRKLLGEASRGIPRILEVRHRHKVRLEDRFVMKPGYLNFHQLGASQEIAHDRNGPIRTTESCAILLPLYQDQGDDGFFTVREIRPIWLRLSWILRSAGMPRAAAWLPGVQVHPRRPETLVVDTRVARFVPLQVFHLLGFRKLRWQGNLLLVSRRSHDVPPRPAAKLRPQEA